ncbi:MAG: CRISPR-associated endonuclease Cas2 [Oscillospiraceae bacterium]|nr:CRISPR-associated endonuclease Cas2 [Oscillospiraceae bacterium]
MLVLITYDVNTETPEGRKRLRRVAKACEDYGQRVQNSVFECEVDAGKLLLVKDRLLKIIDIKSDSLRFYILGNEGRRKVEHFGIKPSYDVKEPLIV